MKPKILSRNVKGINDVNKRLRIQSLLHSWKVDIVFLQEMKMGFINRSIILILWVCSHVGWVFLPSSGGLGGILLMWDNRVVELLEECIGHFIVACYFKNIEDGLKGAIVGVYGSNLDRDRCLLWEEFLSLYFLWDLPWSLCGNFNIIRFPSDRGIFAYL